MTEQLADYSLNELLETLQESYPPNHTPNEQTLTKINTFFETIEEQKKVGIMLTLLDKTTNENFLLGKFLFFEVLAINQKIALLLNSLPKSSSIFPIEKYSIVLRNTYIQTVHSANFAEKTRKSTLLDSLDQSFTKAISLVRSDEHKQTYTILLNRAIGQARSYMGLANES